MNLSCHIWEMYGSLYLHSWAGITCSKPIMEIPEQCVKSVQS